MNVEIGTEVAQFPEKEYINGIFLAVQSRNFFGMKLEIGLVMLCYLALANCLPNGETFARKAESYLGNYCLVLSVVKILLPHRYAK
jgi:hypothetical protein